MPPPDPDHAAQSPTCYRLRLDSSGRILLPAAARTRLQLLKGDELFLTEDEHGFRLRTLEQLLADLQGLVAAHVPAGVSLADELSAERRVEASRE